MRFLIFVLYIAIVSTGFSQINFKSEKAFEKYLAKQIEISASHPISDFEQKLSPAQCQADLRIFKWCLTEAQTTLYRYASKTTVDSAFSAAFEHTNDSLTYLEFLREIAKIQHIIACGHSNWSHADDYIPYRNKTVGLFPFGIGYSGDHCFILNDYSIENTVFDTTVLLRVNHVPVANVIDQLNPFLTQDGSSNTSSTMQATKYFNRAYANFIGSSNTFELDLQNPETGQLFTRTVRAITQNEIDSISALRYPNKQNRGLPLRLNIEPNKSAALYTIEWFKKDYILGKGQDFESFTDSVFAALADQNIETLFIDLRGNTGGWTAYGKYLFAYFIDEPKPYMTNVVAKKYYDFSFDPIKLMDPEYDDTFQMEKNKAGLYEWKNYPSLMAFPPKENRFHGKTYILIDNMTRSCSGMFCSLMREHTKAIFIGEETGATQCGAGGMLCKVQLPHSGIQIRFSTAQYSCAVSDPTNSKGVLPDIPLKNKRVSTDDFWFYMNLVGL